MVLLSFRILINAFDDVRFSWKLPQFYLSESSFDEKIVDLPTRRNVFFILVFFSDWWLQFSFVKDIHVVGEKMNRNGRKMAIYES